MKIKLFQPLTLALGLRYAGSQRQNRFVSFISLFSTFGVAIGVAALIIVLSVMNGFEGQLKGRILGVIPHAQIQSQTDSFTPPPELFTLLDKQPQIQAYAPFSESEGMLQSQNQLAAALIQGVDISKWPKGDRLTQQMLLGELSSLQQGQYHIVLGQGLAQQLGVSLGDRVRLLLTEQSRFTPLGRIPVQRLFTVSGIFGVGADVDNQVALIALSDAKKLLRLEANSTRSLRIWLHEPFSVEALTQTPLPHSLKWLDWRQQRGELFAAVAMEKRMMGLMLILIIAVATFNILSALVMVVGDKEGEIAILRTMGMGRQQIVRIFIILGASSGLIGALIGSLLGIGLTLGLNPLLDLFNLNLYRLAGGSGLPIIVEPLQITVIIFGAISLAFGATLYPAFRAASVKPADALRYE